MADNYNFISYQKKSLSSEESLKKAKEFYADLDTRRSVRDFSDKPVSKELMESLIMAGSTAPSGAHKQPWTFCLVSNPDLKKKIRIAAEEEEYKSYNGRMSEAWLKDLAPIGTDWQKSFIETVPWVVIVFRRAYEIVEGEKRNNYYVNESVGLACGFLLAAIHEAGLVALTHTPSPMNFLTKILNRPENERPFLLIPVGYPAEEVKVPDLKRKSKEDVIVYYE